jgi:site-specific DNA recombinase
LRKLSNPGGPANRVRRVAFYVRVSTENQARVAEGSLKNQEQMLTAELRRRNSGGSWGRHIGSYVDGGFSGSNIERPEFKRLLADVERGSVDAIFFTELSRLSRSLKDFLNIFEFTQEHNCDLVCLKTEIDTTSPFSNLVVRILMVFAEFEREITADRIRRNAYERSKRGLAYGGFEPLGYKRDPEHKGRLLIQDDEAKIVREIFSTYLRKRSLMESLKVIKKKFENPRIQKLSRNGIYGILTSRVYVGIREIKNNGSVEEVPAAWKPIVTKKTFDQVREILSGNGPGPRSPRHNYIFSGLIRCSKCDQKLQGKSGKSRSGKMRYYYAHSRHCTSGGLHSIEAEDLHKIIEDWLRTIIQDRDRFNELIEKGRAVLNKQIRDLNSNLKRLDYEEAALRKKLADATTHALTRKSSATGDLMEKEAEQILARIQENECQSEESRGETETLSAIVSASDEALFRSYAELAKRFLDLSAREKSRRVFQIFKTLTLGEESLNLELVHSNGQSFASQNVAFLRDRIPLPGNLLLKNRAYIQRLYRDEKLSSRSIGRRIGAAQSTVSDALHRHRLTDEAREPNKRPQQVPFGFDYKKGKFVPNPTEQQVIRMIRQLRTDGLSLRDIAANLNRKLIATKRSGVWDHSMIQKILDRSVKKQHKT